MSPRSLTGSFTPAIAFSKVSDETPRLLSLSSSSNNACSVLYPLSFNSERNVNKGYACSPESWLARTRLRMASLYS